MTSPSPVDRNNTHSKTKKIRKKSSPPSNLVTIRGNKYSSNGVTTFDLKEET